jgi:hypothetical protein
MRASRCDIFIMQNEIVIILTYSIGPRAGGVRSVVIISFRRTDRQGVGQIIEKLFQLNHGRSPLLAGAICLALSAMIPE